MSDPYTLRSDFERIRAARNETRPLARLVAHYEIETKLARQLLDATWQQRSALYSDVYDQLFESLPDHPQHAVDRNLRMQGVRARSEMLLKELGPDSTYVEIGCGDAALTKIIAAYVATAIGVDVTGVLVSGDAPVSFQFLKTDGIRLDMSANTADLVYSNQLMEHLHADDAIAQLREIHRVLKPGRRYVCCTPNRLTGPHDISVYFGYEPTGFHLREYDHRALDKIFRSVGFSDVRAVLNLKGKALDVPIALIGCAEAILEVLPRPIRTKIALLPPVSNALGVNIIGIK